MSGTAELATMVAGEEKTPRRKLIRGEGQLWAVWEEPAAHVPGARGLRALICDTWNSRRRIWRYPADWYRLADEQLLSLFLRPQVAAS